MDASSFPPLSSNLVLLTQILHASLDDASKEHAGVGVDRAIQQHDSHIAKDTREWQCPRHGSSDDQGTHLM